MQSYDYAHRSGVEPITWERFAELSHTLVEKLAPYNVDAVVGIARAGLFPATAVSIMLRRDLYPVRVSRRFNDEVKFHHPQWIVDVAEDVKDQIVAVVDEIADTGETLAIVAERVKQRGAKRVITASLISHSWAEPLPDVVALTTDAFVMFPWDEQVYIDGQWQIHPEIVDALKRQSNTNH
ncbi:MAG TPA: phosphoribosyltransferase [Anaerolineae bacterium]|nr:phosphoribosyltransferase [Anaerolineae bacterium]